MRAPWRDPASLGAKLVLILSAAGLAGALAITLLLAAIITPSFDRLETQAIRTQVERTQAMLGDESAKVERAVRMIDPAHLSTSALRNSGVQGAAYLAPDGRVEVAQWLDPRAARPAGREALAAAIKIVDAGRVTGRGGAGSFYLHVGHDLAVIGLAQAPDGAGLVVMARVLTAPQVTALLQRDAQMELGAGSVVDIRMPSRGWADVRVPVLGVDGRPVAAVRFGVRRDVSLLGRRMLLLAVAGSTVLLLIVLMVLRRVIARQVLKPLRRIEAHMGRVRASGSLSPFDDDGRRDEIGALGRAFNAMLHQLRDLREQIEVQSFALGRSESAVAVMHNVRNALNPVSTILSQGIAQAPPVDRATLERAIGELGRDGVTDARRAKLTEFVSAGMDAWSTSRETMQRELKVGRAAMVHALEIIGQQQQQAHERPLLERCDVTDIVARNATIARYGQEGAIAFSYPSVAHRVLANRVILSQVIGNLFGNAAEAIAATGRRGGTIAVAVAERDGQVIVSIGDDGEGFDAAAAQALFQRGYSTRRHKSGGLGLHWCANSMIAMNGSLRLESAGPGQGAVAVLTLKAAEPVRAAA